LTRIGYRSISSGSKGNCSILWDDENLLVFDFGISLRRFKNPVLDLGLSMDNVSVFITHEHSDHSSGLGILKKNIKADLYTREKTALAIGMESYTIKSELVLGNFKVSAVSVSHDAADPVAYIVENGNAKISIVSDLGFPNEELISKMKGSEILAVEANHDIGMLMDGSYPQNLKRRISSNHGHLSNDQSADLIGRVCESNSEIILTHLSQENNTPELATTTVRTYLEKNRIKYRSISYASQSDGSRIYYLEV
jgi:phosphoribosyl 1,2-cyclic phosphodiesterase